MTTPTTPLHARELAEHLESLRYEAEHITRKSALTLRSLADQVEALQLALETERAAANLYAKQVAHWIEKHDALLAQQLEASESRDAYAEAADEMAEAHKVERDWLTAKLNQQASMVEKCMVAINANADIGEQAEFRAAEFEQLYDDEAIVAKTYESHITELKEKNETLIAELAAIRADMVAERDALTAKVASFESRIDQHVKTEIALIVNNKALKDAARLALDALENLDGVDTESEIVTIYVQDEINALKAVL